MRYIDKCGRFYVDHGMGFVPLRVPLPTAVTEAAEVPSQGTFVPAATPISASDKSVAEDILSRYVKICASYSGTLRQIDNPDDPLSSSKDWECCVGGVDCGGGKANLSRLTRMAFVARKAAQK